MKLKSSHSKAFFSTIRKQAIDSFSILQKDIISPIRDTYKSIHNNVWLFFSLIIGISVRDYYLPQPMRYDESMTFLNFVNGSLSDMFYYPVPNNHVLHTILVKIVTLAWGANPTSIRLVAFWAGIGCIPLIFSLCRTLKQSGVFAAMAVSIFPYLVFYSTNARGYTLLTFLTLVLALVGLLVVKKTSMAGVILIALIASLGMLTMPSMLFPIAGVYCWMISLFLINKQNFKTISYKFIIPCSIFTAVFTVILYTPVVIVSHGIETIVNNRFVQPQPLQEFLHEVYPHIARTLVSFFRDIPGFLLAIFAILVLVGTFGFIKKRDYPLLMLLPSVLFASATIFFAMHKIPFDRTWIYMIPFIIVVADSGFTLITEGLSPKIRFYITLATFFVSVALGKSLISSNTIASYSDTGSFSEAPIAAKFLRFVMVKNKEYFLIKSKLPADYPVSFYLWYYNAPGKGSNPKFLTGNTVYIVKKSDYSITDMTNKPVIQLLDFDNMSIYQEVNAPAP